MSYIFQFFWTPLAVFVVGYSLLRLMGKRAVSEMSSFDLLVIIVLGTTITEPIVTKRLSVAAYYSVVISIVYFIFSSLTLFNKLKTPLTASPTVLVRSGDIDEKGLKKTRLTINELLGELRVNGYSKVQDVELALMEETGKISVIPTSKARALQPSDLNLTPSKAYVPIPLVIDGQLFAQNLGYIQKNQDWLFEQLKNQNISDYKRVSLATYDPQSDGVQVDKVTSPSQSKGPWN